MSVAEGYGGTLAWENGPRHSNEALDMRLANLFDPVKLPITAVNWTDADGVVYTAGPNFTWNEPFGRRLCIIDVENRPMNGTDELFYSGPFNWTKFTFPSVGVLGHYLYAQIHGYDYKLIRTYMPDDRKPHWLKVNALLDLLDSYEFVVFMDMDAQYERPEVPIEWLLNHWNITQHTALALAVEPNLEKNLDGKGHLGDNTGFVIAQNLPRTHQILKNWIICPDERIDTFEGCSNWRYNHLAEQTAFSEYIRYIFNDPDDILELPCDEANGYPDSGEGCNGRLVRHMWTAKDSTKVVINDAFMHILMWQLHNSFITDPSATHQLHESVGIQFVPPHP